VERQANVLVFCTDEHRSDYLGCMGHPFLQTPNIDRIAAEGVLFRSCYTSSPACMPARATMMTGLTNRASGVRSNGVSLPEDIPTLPGLLANAGYRTHSVGKLHLKTWGKPGGINITEFETAEQNPERRVHWNNGSIRKSPDNYYGFQTQDSALGHVDYINGDYKTWLDEHHPGAFAGYACDDTNPGPLTIEPELHYNNWIADRAVDFIDSRNGNDQPFFLWCSFPDPHFPFAAVRSWSDVYADAEVDLSRSTRELGDEGRSSTMTAIGQGTEVLDSDHIRACIRQTCGMISHVDEQVGRVLDALSATETEDNTVVIFISDHGDQLGEHGLFYKGIYPYDGHAHIPFVVKVPWSTQRNKVVDDVVSMLDLVPTVLDLAGVDQPEDETMSAWWRDHHGPVAPPLPGEVLTPVLLTRALPERRNALVEYDSDTDSFDLLQIRTLVTNEYKLVYYAPTNETLLFSRVNDPDEMHNLAQDDGYHGVLMDLLKQLVHEISRTEARRPRQICGA
jgi:arylsulfatase A-like enzyme